MVSAVLIAVGVLLLLFGVLSSSPSSGTQAALSVVVALAAIYLFFMVGRSIWRDLREPRDPKPSDEVDRAEDRVSAEEE
ncbi:MAG: hypothetical protein ACFB50_18880 [Rubrobacteraceae bacterium]